MIEKFQDWLLEKDIHDVAYWLTVILYTTIMIATFILSGWIFGNWCMIVIGTIVMNLIRQYSGGFHCSTLVKCIIFTNFLFITFGLIAYYTIDFYLVSVVLGILSIVLIYHNTPAIETDYKDEPIKWQKEQALEWCLIFFFISLVLELFGLKIIASNMMWSIILVAVIIFPNPKR